MEQLEASYVQIDKESGKDKFELKLDGRAICHCCYALAVGYCPRRLSELKSSIRSNPEDLRRILPYMEMLQNNLVLLYKRMPQELLLGAT